MLPIDMGRLNDRVFPLCRALLPNDHQQENLGHNHRKLDIPRQPFPVLKLVHPQNEHRHDDDDDHRERPEPRKYPTYHNIGFGGCWCEGVVQLVGRPFSVSGRESEQGEVVG